MLGRETRVAVYALPDKPIPFKENLYSCKAALQTISTEFDFAEPQFGFCCRGVCIVFYLSHHYFILKGDFRPEPISFWNAIQCTWLALPPLMIGTFTNTAVDWFIIVRWGTLDHQDVTRE